MIVLQTKGSALFESAYFVLRRGYGKVPSGDMLAESNRIIGDGHAYMQKRRRHGALLPLLCGFLVGCALGAAIAAIILL